MFGLNKINKNRIYYLGVRYCALFKKIKNNFYFKRSNTLSIDIRFCLTSNTGDKMSLFFEKSR